MVDLLPPAAGGRVQLEGPQEVRGVLEVGPHGQDLDQGVSLGQETLKLWQVKKYFCRVRKD